MAKYRDFISENTAPQNVKRIGIYDSNGSRIGVVPLGNLAFPDAGQKLYSFGALSDVHINYETATSDFSKALSFLDTTEAVAFTCVCGDLTGNGSDEHLALYKSYVDRYSADTPVYAVTGNHEGEAAGVESRIEAYTGHPLYYSFTHGDDVFIMVGVISTDGKVFADGELQWLYETLEANRNKRCFVFQHIYPGGQNEPICGNGGGLYTNWWWYDTDECAVFEQLMAHYKNVTWFHGHSHLRFSLQRYGQLYANYSQAGGYRSVHIPSLAAPREDADGDGTYENSYADSEGYVVDVYENGIHLRGRDFVKGEFLPIASYWLDTTLQTIEAKTYKDSTGTITT